MTVYRMHGFRLSAICAALLAVYGTAIAQDASVAELTTPDSYVSVGAGAWSDDRPQQGIYDGMREKGGYGLLDADVVKRDNATGTWVMFRVRELGLDTRELRAEWLRQGNLGVSLEYSRIPRDNPFTFNTGLQGIGTTSLTINSSGAFQARDVTLGTVRDRVKGGFYMNLAKGLDFRLTATNEDKEGTRNWGLGSQPLFMVEPIDSSIRQLEATLSFNRDKLQLSGGYYGSWYDTSNNLIFGLRDGVAQPGTTQNPNPTPLSQPLSNQAHQLFVNGGYSFTPTTRGTFKLSRSTATQDEPLPTFGLAAPNDPFVGMQSSLNGRIDTTVAEVGLTARPMPKLSMVAQLRYRDENDKTPLLGVIGNNGTGVVTVHNTPQSYETTTGRVEGTYRLPSNLSLIGGVELKRQDRSAPQFVNEIFVPYRTKLDEDTYRIQLRRGMSETVNGSIALLHSKRDGSVLTPTEHFPSDLINPIHIANRDRDKVRGVLDWTASDSMVVQFTAEHSKDDYANDRRYGLKEGKASLFSVDATYVVNDDWQVSAWYAHDQNEARQFNGRWDRQNLEELEVERESNLKDKGDTVGVSLRGKITPRLKVGANALYAKSVSEYNHTITSFPVTAVTANNAPYPTGNGGEPPDITNKLTRLGLFAEYALQKTSTVRFDLIHEMWKTDDWTWQFADGSPFTYGTAGATADGTFVRPNPKQDSTFVGARYIYRF